jgi:DDE superfamily endonuclease
LHHKSVKLFQTPTTAEAWQEVASQFNERWNFPNCIGAIDGKHVMMNAPPSSGSVFYNYKKSDSIVLMGIADAEYKFLYVDVGRNGRFSDGGVFNRCSFAQAMDNNQCYVIDISELVPLTF